MLFFTNWFDLRFENTGWFDSIQNRSGSGLQILVILDRRLLSLSYYSLCVCCMCFVGTLFSEVSVARVSHFKCSIVGIIAASDAADVVILWAVNP